MRHIDDVHADISWSWWPIWSPWKQLRLGRLWTCSFWTKRCCCPVSPCFAMFRHSNLCGMMARLPSGAFQVLQWKTTQQMSTPKSDEFLHSSYFRSSEQKQTEQCSRKQFQPCLRHILLRSQPSIVDDWGTDFHLNKKKKKVLMHQDKAERKQQYVMTLAGGSEECSLRTWQSILLLLPGLESAWI